MWCVTSIYDRKTQEFTGLYLTRTTDAAIRMFRDAVLGGQQTMISEHPEDFFLVELGTFDEETGDLDPYQNVNLVEADEIVDGHNRRQAPNTAAHKARMEQISELIKPQPQQIDIEEAIEKTKHEEPHQFPEFMKEEQS